MGGSAVFGKGSLQDLAKGGPGAGGGRGALVLAVEPQGAPFKEKQTLEPPLRGKTLRWVSGSRRPEARGQVARGRGQRTGEMLWGPASDASDFGVKRAARAWNTDVAGTGWGRHLERRCCSGYVQVQHV